MTKKRRKRQRSPQSWLLFIDANILLDFYRLQGESAIRTLELLEKHKDSLILGDQLRMEFMNNRQRAVLAGIEKVAKPQRPTLPAILLDTQAAKTWMKAHGTAEKRWKTVRNRIEAILNDPIQADVVYQRLMRIFDHESQFNLCRPNKRRFEIRRLARKRFSLGYPPRKPNAISLGDSLHWEWIIACARPSERERHDVMIVSRDGDFGANLGNISIINDWLLREFKERVSPQRQIVLLPRLTDALSKLDEHVNAADVEEEDRIIKSEEAAQEESDRMIESLRAFIQEKVNVRPEEWRALIQEKANVRPKE
jgi:PIN domain